MNHSEAFASLVKACIPAASTQELARLQSMENRGEPKGFENADSALDTLLANLDAAMVLFVVGATVDDLYALHKTGLQGTFSGALNVALENADVIAAAARRLAPEPKGTAQRAERFRQATLCVLCAEHPGSRAYLEAALGMSGPASRVN